MLIKENLNVTVIVGTYGDRETWEPLAKRATASAENQTAGPREVLHYHEKTLARARNAGAESARSEWLIFLDADDELDSRYVEMMFKAEGDIRRPMTLGVYPDGSEDETPVFIPRKDLLVANFIVIGAMVRRDQFLRLGGFDEYPIMEDWALFLKLWKDGAQIGDANGAIYRVHVNPNSRNTGGRVAEKTYVEIKRRFR